MVHLTFVHDRDIFTKNKFRNWVYKYFPSAKFDCYQHGRWYPSIKIPYDEFRENHKNLPQSVQNKIAGIKCEPCLMTYLIHGIRPIYRITNLHWEFEKYTGRKPDITKRVTEIVEI
jgi:hypothetical protein